jgi:hypothetical protein
MTLLGLRVCRRRHTEQLLVESKAHRVESALVREDKERLRRDSLQLRLYKKRLRRLNLPHRQESLQRRLFTERHRLTSASHPETKELQSAIAASHPETKELLSARPAPLPHCPNSARKGCTHRSSSASHRLSCSCLLAARDCDAPLPKRDEELTEQLCALVAENAGSHLEAMIEARVTSDPEERIDCPALWIGTPINDAGHARMHEGSGTHRARLQSHVRGDPVESPTARRGRGATNRHELGMRGRIARRLSLVVGSRHLPPRSVDQHATDRHFAYFRGLPRFFQSALHEVNVLRFAHHRGS